jgi:hypothetical protein
VSTEPGSLRLWGYLDDVNKFERLYNRPMLSALVINRNGLPGDGFFSLAREFGHEIEDDRDSKQRFWEEEVDRVRLLWSRLK